MSDWLLELVPVWGPWLLAGVTFLSCLAVPIPSSLIMLTAGGFVAAGDLLLVPVGAAALGGAVVGDQLAYWLARKGGPRLMQPLQANPKRARAAAMATAYLDRHGGVAVFLTRWLFSPLGPWINFSAGAAGLGWVRFSVWGLLGEMFWVGIYVGMGIVFAGNIQQAYDLVGSSLGLLATGALTVILGLWLRASLRHEKR